MLERKVHERLSGLGLDDEALSLLRGLGPMIEAHADEVAEQVVDAMVAYPELAGLIGEGEERRRAAVEGRKRYLLSICDTSFGPEYVEHRRLTGQRQEAAGLTAAWIPRIVALHAEVLRLLVSREAQGDTDTINRTMRALSARFVLDVDISLEAYIERREAGLTSMAEELARERRQLQKDLRLRELSLRETTERARAAEELASIATLVAGLAHEIGTPMSVIQGHAKMLERDVEGEQGLWRLRTIQEQIGRISRIIQTLLQMAHPQRRSPQEVDLAELLGQSLSFVSEKLSRRCIEVRRRIPEGTTVVGDRERLQQLFLNLVLNAADAMPEGGELRVELSRVGGRVRVEVSDTGDGIASEDLERIFEPFFTTKEAGQGNGLGLMVCRGIVADHGGELDVTSEPGVGTTFSVELPRVESR